jgi:hypothetical protein
VVKVARQGERSDGRGDLDRAAVLIDHDGGTIGPVNGAPAP